jgi:hypothetical protein
LFHFPHLSCYKSTVGYGSASPAAGFQNNNPSDCAFVTTICALNALTGILFAGLCGAILFSKVLRVQSHAQVVFSDPIVVRYGKGACDEDEVDDDMLPFPVLEFRIINRLFNEDGGEIVDATLNVVAKVDEQHDNDEQNTSLHSSTLKIAVEDDANDDSLHNKTNSQELRGSSWHGMSSRNQEGKASSLISPYRRLRNLKMNSFGEKSSEGLHSDSALDSLPLGSSIGGTRTVSGVSYPSAHSHTSNQLYYKMHIETTDHPFFKRVWLARHILDEHSPIVKARVKHAIRRNHGAWPYNKLHTYDDIRNSLQFNNIIVSLNGVANISASTVYAQKI